MGTTRSNQLKKQFMWKRVNDQSSAGLGYAYDKLIAEFIIDCDSTRKTAIELIKTFVEAERFIIIDKKIYSLAFFDKEGKLIENGTTEKTGDNGTL